MIQLGGELGIFDHRLDSSRFNQVNGLLSRFMGNFSDFFLVSRHFLPSPSVCPPHYSSFSPLSAKFRKLEVSSSNSQFYWFYKYNLRDAEMYHLSLLCVRSTSLNFLRSYLFQFVAESDLESMLYKTKKQHSEPTTAKNKAVEMEYQTQEIPSSIVIDILGRLPVKTILLCRHVCKAWNTMLSENYFYMLYGGHSPTSLILQVKGPSLSCLRSVCLVEAGDNSSITCRDLYISRGSWKRVPNFRYQLGNSCNGLICLRELPSREPVAIWNPIMGQFSILPKPVSVSDDKVVSGFGFCSRTNKYKVLRNFHEKQAPQSQWTTEIYDFDVGNKWRRVSDAPCLLPSRIPGFYLSNSLHWILDYSDSTSSSHELICCFNFMDERFWFSPAPPIFSSNRRFQHHWSNLGVLQGSLSICSIDARAFRPDVQVWVMEEYGVTDSWVRKLSFRDPAVEWWDPHRWLQVVNVLKNGKIVILCAHRFVLLYDPEDKSFMIMKSLNFPAIAHFPCFISLKDVVKRDSAWFSSGPSVAYL